MNGMIAVIKLIGSYIGLAFLIAYYVAFLIVIIISVVYCMGYVYDTLFGNWLLKIGIFFLDKFPAIKNIGILKKIKTIMNSKQIYLRYETPLFTYCFSFLAIFFIDKILGHFGVRYTVAISPIIYIIIYFIGMRRRCHSEEYYDKVLKNNIDFLKLSFIPLTFLITVIGFAFTVTGFKVQEINIDFLSRITEAINQYGIVNGLASQALQIINFSILLLALMYIASIPIQLVSYFTIQVIYYFKKFGNSYKKLLKIYMEILHHFIR